MTVPQRVSVERRQFAMMAARACVRLWIFSFSLIFFVIVVSSDKNGMFKLFLETSTLGMCLKVFANVVMFGETGG